ncbi:MAG: LEA type 2 family protein [Phycisphaeraceae bacterium JB051]
MQSAKRSCLLLLFLSLAMSALTGCETLSKVLDGMAKPTAQLQSVSIADLSLTDATVDMAVQVNNPYSVAIPNVNLDYALATEQVDFVTGKITSDKAIPAGSSSTIHIPVKVTYASLLQLASSIKPGQVVPYQVNATFSTKVPGIGNVSLPLKKQGELPIPMVPKVSIANVTWDKVSLSETTATIDLDITNLNDFGLTMKGLDYAFAVGGKNVISSKITEPMRFNKGQAQRLQIPVSFNAMSLGLGALNIIKGGNASYTLSGKLDADTPYGSLSLPILSQ